MSDSFVSIPPKSEHLKRWIRYYYFHRSDSASYDQTIIYYPHYAYVINLYRNSRIEWDENSSIYRPVTQKEPFVTLTINYKKSKMVQMKGAFDKLGIVFNPLGLNSFLEGHLWKYAQGRITEFDAMNPDLLEIAQKVYQAGKPAQKRDLLDAFFESRYIGFKDARVIKAVHLIHQYEHEGPLKSKDIAAQVGVSRETLFRLFKKHLCCSVEQYKSVVRFRKALDVYHQSKHIPKLTQVAAASAYYDQSDFIRHFKNATGFNPKSFFSKLQAISSEDTYWTLLD